MNPHSIVKLLLLIFLPVLVFAQGSLTGHITSKGEGERLVGVTVLLNGTVRGTTTNSKGEFRLTTIPSGSYTVVFSMVGYQRETRSGVVIEDGRETSLDVAMTQTPIQTEQIVITANKREESLQDVPVSISVMDATEIKYRNNQTIEDALRYVPGVNITGGQVNIRGSSGYSRGAGSRVLMLLDGVPFLAGDTGELNFESIPIGQVDRIEIVKGATSALYGSSALGGVINVITKQIPEIPETVVRSYGGFYNKPSYDEWKWSDRTRSFNGQSLSHARRVGDLGVALFFSRQFDDGYRQNDYRRRYNFYIKTKEDISESQSITLNFGMLYQYGGQFLYWRNLDSALIPPTQQRNDNVKSIRYYASAIHNTVLSEKFLLTTRGIWYHNDWGYETINAIGRTESVSDQLNAEALGTLIVNDRHTATFGLEMRFDRVAADLFGERNGGGLAIYGQDQFRLVEPLTFTIGARYDLQSMGLTSGGSQINPKAAVAYAPVSGTTLRASYGRGFRIPSVAEAFLAGEVSNLAAVPNKDLKPEKSSSYEFGVSQSIADWATLDAAIFRSDYSNLIEAGLTVSSSNIPQIQWRNVTKARVQGYETALKLGLFNGNLNVNVGYTYVDPQDQTLHDVLKYRPRNLFYTNMLAKVGMFSAGVDFRLISRVERIDVELVDLGIIPDGDERTKIVVADARLGADFAFVGVPLLATLNVNNVFQRNYVELIGNIAPPRTYFVVIEWKP